MERKSLTQIIRDRFRFVFGNRRHKPSVSKSANIFSIFKKKSLSNTKKLVIGERVWVWNYNSKHPRLTTVFNIVDNKCQSPNGRIWDNWLPNSGPKTYKDILLHK